MWEEEIRFTVEDTKYVIKFEKAHIFEEWKLGAENRKKLIGLKKQKNNYCYIDYFESEKSRDKFFKKSKPALLNAFKKNGKNKKVLQERDEYINRNAHTATMFLESSIR